MRAGVGTNPWRGFAATIVAAWAVARPVRRRGGHDMTAIADVGAPSRPQDSPEPSRREVRCEVYCSGTDEVLGYLVAGGTASCLEQALIQNGFSLVPIGSRRPKAEQALVAA
jgi:hypothetical protein